MGVLREELRHNLTKAGAVLVGYGSLKDHEGLPFPALTQVVSYAVRVEPADSSAEAFHDALAAAEAKVGLLSEHVKACLRRYGFKGESLPVSVRSFDDDAALSAGIAQKKGGEVTTEEFGSSVRFGTVFTDATWKKKH